jgi:hypothetical protein
MKEFVVDAKKAKSNASRARLEAREESLLKRLIRFGKHHKYKVLASVVVAAGLASQFKHAAFAMKLKSHGVNTQATLRNIVYARNKKLAGGLIMGNWGVLPAI